MTAVILSPAQMRRMRNLQGRPPTPPPPPMGPVVPTGISWPALALWMSNYIKLQVPNKVNCLFLEVFTQLQNAFSFTIFQPQKQKLGFYQSILNSALPCVLYGNEEELPFSLCRHAECNWHQGTVFTFVLSWNIIIIFFLYLFVNLWTKEDFLTPFPLPVQDSEGGAPSASALSLAAVQSARSLGLLCHLQQAKPSARACAAPDRLAFFVLQHPLWNCLCHLCGRSPKIKFKQEELEFLIVTLHDQLAVQIKESGYWRTF